MKTLLPHKVPYFRSRILIALVPLGFLSACAAELEDGDAYVDEVTPGIGATGVNNCDYLDCPNQQPTPPGTSVQPDTVQPDTVQPNTVQPGNPMPSMTAPDTVNPPVNPTTEPVAPTGAPILSAECMDVPTRIFAASCGDGAGCHGAGSPWTDLVSDLPNLPERLRDKPAFAVGCNGDPIIDSANPEASVLTRSLTEDDRCTFTTMPVSGTLTADEVRCVTEWAQAVAAGEI